MNNYRNLTIVGTKGIAIMMNSKKQYKRFDASSNLVASLQALEFALSKIETNDDMTKEPVRIIVGSKSPIKGFACGTFVDYLRTGKNTSGKEFTEEEMRLIMSCANLLAARLFNVRIVTDEFVSLKEKEAKQQIKDSWEIVKSLSKPEADKEDNKETAKERAARLMKELQELQKQMAAEENADEMDEDEDEATDELANLEL